MRSHQDKDKVLRRVFVALAQFSRHSLSPTQSVWAREKAAECLWALGVERFEDFEAIEPIPVGSEHFALDATW